MLALEDSGTAAAPLKVVRNATGESITAETFRQAFITMITAETLAGDFKTNSPLIAAFASTPLAQFKHLPAKVNLINVPASVVSASVPSPAPLGTTPGGAKLSGSKRTSSDKITLKKAKTMRKQT